MDHQSILVKRSVQGLCLLKLILNHQMYLIILKNKNLEDKNEEKKDRNKELVNKNKKDLLLRMQKSQMNQKKVN